MAESCYYSCTCNTTLRRHWLRTSKRTAFHSLFRTHLNRCAYWTQPCPHQNFDSRPVEELDSSFFAVLFIAMCLSDDIYVSRHKRFVLSADITCLSGGRGEGELTTLGRGSHLSHSNTVIEIKFLNRSLTEA